MSRSDDLEPLAESMEATFARLGLPDPGLISQVVGDWDAVAGKHWRGRSMPVSVKGKTLVVEAATPSLVAFLKYGKAALLESLENRFGPGVFTDVEVTPPGRL